VNRWQRIWRVGGRLAICGLLLFWILQSICRDEARSALKREGRVWEQLTPGQQREAIWTIGSRELWHTLTLVDPLWLGMSWVCMGGTLVFGMVRWQRVLGAQGLALSFGRAAEISLVAHFFNSFLLGSTGGDVLKAYYAARETHHKKTEAVVAVFADRLIGLFAMLLFAVLMMPFNGALLSHHRALRAACWLVFAMFLACSSVVGLSFWGGLSRTWPRARSWLRSLPKGELLERGLEACRVLGRERRLLGRALVLSMMLNAVCVLQFLALGRGLGLPVSPWVVFLVVPVVICIAALPVTPSGLGLRENLFVLLLAHPALGVPATEALSLSLLAYAGSLSWSVLGGLVYLGMKDRRFLTPERDLTASPAD
jgi:hypothetical protein